MIRPVWLHKVNTQPTPTVHTTQALTCIPHLHTHTHLQEYKEHNLQAEARASTRTPTRTSSTSLYPYPRTLLPQPHPQRASTGGGGYSSAARTGPMQPVMTPPSARGLGQALGAARATSPGRLQVRMSVTLYSHGVHTQGCCMLPFALFAPNTLIKKVP
jgi:hypothetical protein